MIFKKITFFGMFTAIGLQFTLGVNFVYAICDNEIKAFCSEDAKSPYGGHELCDERKDKEIASVIKHYVDQRQSTYPNAEDQRRRQREVAAESYNSAHQDNKPSTKAFYEAMMCILEYTLSQNQSGTSGKQSNSSTNQSSSSGASKQAKSNQQVVTNQPNQTNSGDLSKMSRSQLIDFAGSAADRGDYAQAYAAELQLAKDHDPEIARQALRRVGFRLREGQGVNRNFSEAHRILQQAASMGDVVAYSHLCKSYMDGIGVPENHTKALENCLFADEKGDLTAQTNLGVLYEIGNGIQRRQKLSDLWTCRAAAQGEPTAVNNVKNAKIRCN